VPLRLMSDFGVVEQLYAARLLSLVFFLIGILAAYGVMCELTPPGHLLRFFVPLGMLCLPGLADIMSAVNNDVPAIAFFCLFLWGSVRLLLRGISLPVMLATTLAAGLGALTKETAYIGLPLLAVVVLFSAFRGRRQWLAWGLTAVTAVILLLAVFDWGDAAVWVRRSFQGQPTRIRLEKPVVGEHALALEVGAAGKPQEPYRIYQLLPLDDAGELQGKTVTLAAWMWADRPVQARSPMLHVYEGYQDHYRTLSLGVEPAFYAFTATLTTDPRRSWIMLAPLVSADPAPLHVYYDGLVLTPGLFPAGELPQFDNQDASSGVWAGQPFTNLIRNASAESSGLRLRPWADRLGAALLPDGTRPSWIMGMLLDGRSTVWFHSLIAQNLFRSFWGRFGWGHVPMLGAAPYRILALLTAAALVGAGIFLYRRRRSLSAQLLFFFALTLAAAWGLTFVRSENYVLMRVYFPPARYVYPVVIPALIVLHTGWNELYRPIRRRLPARLAVGLYAAFVAVPLLWGLVSIWIYYHGPTG